MRIVLDRIVGKIYIKFSMIMITVVSNIFLTTIFLIV